MLKRLSLGILIIVFGVTKSYATEFFEMGLLCEEDDGIRYVFLLDADKSFTFLKLPVVGEPSVENFDSDSWEQVSEHGIVLSFNHGYKLISLSQSELSGIFYGSTISKKGITKTIECRLLK